MFGIWKILRFVSFILSAIVQAEEELDTSAGSVKKAQVLKLAEGEAVQLGDFDFDKLLEVVGQLVDALVALFNLLGIFKPSPT